MTNDRSAGLLFLLTGIYGVYFSWPLPLGRWNAPGPGVFPLTLSLLLLLSGVTWFIRGKRRSGARSERETSAAAFAKLATPAKIVVLTALVILALDWVGYRLAASLYIFLLLLWVSRYRLVVSLILAILIGVGSWYFFERILSVQLPRGMLPS